jgi:hypothetical protein
VNPTLTFICLLVAFVAFVLAAANVVLRRVNLIGLGLASWVFVALWAALKAFIDRTCRGGLRPATRLHTV